MNKLLLLATLCFCLTACKKSTPPAPIEETPTVVASWTMTTHQVNVYDSSDTFLGIQDLYLEKFQFTADGALIETDINGLQVMSRYQLKTDGGKQYIYITSINDTGETYTDQYLITSLTAHQIDFTTGTIYSAKPFYFHNGVLDRVTIRIVGMR